MAHEGCKSHIGEWRPFEGGPLLILRRSLGQNEADGFQLQERRRNDLPRNIQPVLPPGRQHPPRWPNGMSSAQGV